MATNSSEDQKSQLLTFNSPQEADAYLQRLAEEGSSKPAPESSRADVPPTYDVSINNQQGTTIKQWIGARMEQRGDPKVYVDVTVGPVHPGDQEIHKDVRSLGLYVSKYSFYYQWWNGKTWVYVPQVLLNEAQPGYYYPAFGIQWKPLSAITPSGSERATSTNAIAGDELVGMEDMPPLEPSRASDMPVPESSFETASKAAVAGTLASAYAAYNDKCVGGDDQGNNCAHFLSDAFIRGGFTELLPNNPHINARCSTAAKRPVRARDMWSWFKSKAIRTSRKIEKNTGIWATFQLKESVYWGGHVIIIDTNKWKYVGRPAYFDWDQYLYQW